MILKKNNIYIYIYIIIIILFIFCIMIIFFYRESYINVKTYNYKLLNYVNICLNFTNENQVKCVIDELKTIIKYNSSIVSKDIKSFNNFILEGGTCKEIAVTYASVFNQLNWSVAFIHPIPNHVIIIITKKISDGLFIYCDIDMNIFNCVRVMVKNG